MPVRAIRLPLVLSVEDRVALERLLRGVAGQPRRVRRRAAVVLLAGAFPTITAAAAQAGVSRQAGSRWCGRYVLHGPHGLFDLPRAGRPCTIPPERKERAIEMALQCRLLRDETIGLACGLSASTVARLRRKHGLVSHRQSFQARLRRRARAASRRSAWDRWIESVDPRWGIERVIGPPRS